MVKFKAKVEDLEELCELASMKGTNEISGKEYKAMEDMLIHVDQTLEIRSMSAMRELLVKLYFKPVQVIEKGDLPISDIETFFKFLNRFNYNDEVTVSLVENKVVIERETPHKIARFISTTPENIASASGAENIDNFKLDAEGYWSNGKVNTSLRLDFDVAKLQDVISDGDVIKQRIYPFVVKEGKFNVSIGNEAYGDMTTDIPVDVMLWKGEQADTRICYAASIDNLFSGLKGKVSVYLVAGGFAPLVVEQHTEKFDFLAFLAPRTEEV